MEKPLVFLTEEDKLRIAKNRTSEERFHLLMRLIRIGKMIEKARKSQELSK